MKRPYTKMYMERKYRERRQVAIAVIIGLTVIITILFCPVGDTAAEKVCVTQLDKNRRGRCSIAKIGENTRSNKKSRDGGNHRRIKKKYLTRLYHKGVVK